MENIIKKLSQSFLFDLKFELTSIFENINVYKKGTKEILMSMYVNYNKIRNRYSYVDLRKRTIKHKENFVSKKELNKVIDNLILNPKKQYF